MFKTLKQGQHYLKTWPMVPKLGLIFPENRIIKATAFAQKIMPFIAVFTIVWQLVYIKGDITALAVTVLMVIFVLSLPIQGLYWLGKRASTELPVQALREFYKIYHKLQKVNVVLPVVKDKPCYQQLAELLNKAVTHLDADFWQDI